MGKEIERKFLVQGEAWRSQVRSETHLVQGYLLDRPDLTLRVRIKAQDAFLTLKGASEGIARSEFEYPIPREDAQSLLAEFALFPPIDKIRYQVQVGAHRWDLDVFSGENAGLVLAEIELQDPEESFARPDWLGEEVSADPRYYNVNLAKRPYRTWGNPQS